MNIFIDTKSGAPIYDQIYSQIKRQIINGTLKENDALPSIRNLAKDLRISVVTTKRAYDELENEGLIYTVAAKGCFVSKINMEFINETNINEIKSHMNEIVKLASLCNLKRKDIVDMINNMMEE